MTPDEMRATAKELWDGAKTRLAEAGLGPAVEKQISITVDQTTSMVLGIMADAAESLAPQDSQTVKARQVLSEFAAKNEALRRAAAKGFSGNDWSEFNRLVDASDGSDDSPSQ